MSLSFDSRPLSLDAPAAVKALDSKSKTIIFSTCGGEGHMIDFDAPDDKNGTDGSSLAGASVVLLLLCIVFINNDSLLQQDEPWSSMPGSVLAALSESTTSLCIMSHRKETMI